LPRPFIFLTAKGDLPDLRIGMSLGADGYLPKPVARLDLLAAVNTRLRRHAQQRFSFAPDFSEATPLEQLGLSPRETDILLWMAQGKCNGDITTRCGISLRTAKKHALHIFLKIGVESHSAATLRASETLSQKSRRIPFFSSAPSGLSLTPALPLSAHCSRPRSRLVSLHHATPRPYL
jgi:DNA-binding NarL/FixJ family response regulator